ncbi:hypothetical protein GCM10007924_27430 [Sneathiella chinensis]|uniref:HTH cro/C1-type domain-containing protein n=1 Tax=Sneathiella chinensis TaxID=349750 RepID=A0ABQ5U5Y9_9PROT|nr:hypothetical protein GCM10007924_27430 [Sneathiella chinensis]
MSEIGKKKTELGAALGLPPSRITDIIKGRRRIQSHEIPELSLFLDLSQNFILQKIRLDQNESPGIPPGRTESIPVVGQISDDFGSYRLWQQEDQYEISLPRSGIAPNEAKFAIEESVTSDFPGYTLYICLHPLSGCQETAVSGQKARPDKQKEKSWLVQEQQGLVARIIGKYEEYC